MKIDALLTDQSILEELGARVTQLRKSQGYTQASLADAAGVSRRTIQHLEAGTVSSQLATLIRVGRVLGFVGMFDQLIPQPVEDLFARYKREEPERWKAAERRSAKGNRPWKWGDE
jgi:DNA-binding XRE family transcriptional regulator